MALVAHSRPTWFSRKVAADDVGESFGGERRLLRRRAIRCRPAINYALWQRAFALVQFHSHRVTRFVYGGDVKTSRFRTQLNSMQSLLRASAVALPDLLAELSLTESPEIADDPDPDIGLSWGLPKTGIDISFDDGRVSSVFLYGPTKADAGIYCGQLPYGLDWNTSFDVVLYALGNPSRHFHGSEFDDGPLGPTPPWIRQDGADYCVHIQFTPDKSQIAMVTIMTVERAP